MRVLLLEPPQDVLDLLDRRRRWGADRWDEMWNGVLHVVPMPSGAVQRFNTEFLAAVRGLRHRLSGPRKRAAAPA